MISTVPVMTLTTPAVRRRNLNHSDKACGAATDAVRNVGDLFG